MKVSIHGSICVTGQIEELRKGFIALGHEHVEDWNDPDVAFLFVGNPPYDRFIETAKNKDKKVIFNILDVPFHVPEIQTIITRLADILPLASRVTTISKATQLNIKECCNIASDVIYYPMRPVKHTGIKKYPFRAMMAGRLRDPNKYSGVAVQALVKAGFKESEVAIVGPEYIGWGTNMGQVSDEVLNDLYNSVDYVICTTKNTGLELTPIEGACCGAIPIVLPHLETFDEFWVNSPLGLHYQLLISTDKISNLITSIESNPSWKTEIKQDMLGYSQLAFRPKLEAERVAAKIIETYQMI